MKDNPKERLSWFLRFANLNIASLDNNRLFSIWTDLRRLAFGSLGPFAIFDEDLVQWPERRKQAEQIQESITKLLNKIFTISAKPKKVMIRPLFSVTEEMEKALETPEDEKTREMGPAMESIISSRFKRQPIKQWSKDYLVSSFYPEINILAGKERVATLFPKIEDKLLLDFISVLSRFPLSSIKRCQECNGWFLKWTRKEKNFCSPKCYFSYAQRERRERIKKVKRGKGRRKEG